jgi:hypothetical protein
MERLKTAPSKVGDVAVHRCRNAAINGHEVALWVINRRATARTARPKYPRKLPRQSSAIAVAG